MPTKKVTILVVALVVVAVIALIVSRSMSKPSTVTTATNPATTNPTPKPSEGASQAPLKVAKTEVPVAQAPAGFPADIPIEKGAKIIQNYNATSDTKLFQATRVFESAKNLDENFKIYSDYINSAGWKLTTSLNQPTLKVLAAKRDKGNLQVTINQNSATKVNTVDLTYSEQR